MKEKTMLEVRELTKYYGKNLAVDRVSFQVPDGQIGILLGPNGAGKSTIIKSIAGFDALTVREHIEYMKMAYSSDITEEEIGALLERFELQDKQDKMGSELSKGMMQKVSICCALAVKPRVILFDEPMVGLDPQAIKELKEVILELKGQQVTVLISTHMLEMVEELWDIMYVMKKGKIIGSYRKEEVGNKDLDDLFFEMTGGE